MDAPLTLDIVSAEEEQAWNRRHLAEPVTAPAIRFWGYREPALVLGCSQRRAISAETVRERAGLDLAARDAGGGAVLVGPWMLSASILLPLGHRYAQQPPALSYHWLGEAYRAVLAEVGIASEVLTPETARRLQREADPDIGWACYGGFSPGEVVVGRRKLVGLAQVRRAKGVLFVAGLLFGRTDWTLLCRAFGRPPGEAQRLADGNTCCVDEAGETLSPLALLCSLQQRLWASLGDPSGPNEPW
ncbi:lipoate--protein ligase family protein [Pseudogulbenkiania ferrooxidans]|uniref:Biotin/lipoate A/B protein ligase n=1 Tax=Pseudogulbenkiania ferrooxidans 2002 TaxID=279714 RepID=B9Z010_9NEIS|nr:ligase [Pseudogulbenkiania ferrooxidans]EEG09893.1 biotin/lipoate A/B protein ligase [Pseudogulbenkiania ferrooxidans 2002]